MSGDSMNGFLPPVDAGRNEQASAIARGDRPALPKRFYKDASAGLINDAYALLLDGRPARTPGRAPLAVPIPEIADILVEEWQAQVDVINPATMPMTRLVNSIIDGVSQTKTEVAAEIVKYAGSDLICYRASSPERLVKQQEKLWDPILDWVRDTHSAKFILSEGVMFVSQSDETLAAIERVVKDQTSPYAIGGLHVLTTLSGSALIALALAGKRLTVDEAWVAAHVDEDVQAEIWGADDEALARRALRYQDFAAASALIRHAWDT